MTKRSACASLFLLVVDLTLWHHASAQVTCLDCHDTVEEGRFRESAHGQSATEPCRTCHKVTSLSDEGHETPPPVDCTTCHGEASRTIKDSVHGAKEGDEKKACTSCHGSHYVEPISKGTREKKVAVIKQMCGTCHEKAMTDHSRSVHGQSRSSKAPSCTDCHGSHDIMAPSDREAQVNRLNQAATCASCHTDPEAGFSAGQIAAVKDYFQSVHGMAISRSGLVVSATCVDCHGAHNASSLKTNRTTIPQICGRCHKKALEDYMASVHGKPLQEGNSDVPICTDCHTSHKIKSPLDPSSSVYPVHVSETCLKCHGNAALINKYGFTPLRKETYLKSYHGAASKLGDKSVANCGSCHEHHLILPQKDPRSSINPQNIRATCGKCHETGEPKEEMDVGKIHVAVAKERHPVPATVEVIYILLIAGTMTFFLLMILLDLRRRLLH